MARCKFTTEYSVQIYGASFIIDSVVTAVGTILQVSSLDDVKTSNSQQSESTNAAKTIALDHLGVVAARIRTSMLNVHQYRSSTKADGVREKGKSTALKSLDEVRDAVPTLFSLTKTECAGCL
jgi:hypothetical protein